MSDWICPYCSRLQVPTAVTRTNSDFALKKVGPNGDKAWARVTQIDCASRDCGKQTLDFAVLEDGVDHRGHPAAGRLLQRWRILPPNRGKPQPEFIPRQLRDDYEEAYAIRDLSPKASATLARRCLQGMIRDFCGISKSRLVDEINALADAVNTGKAPSGVTPETIGAIDAVRSVGNIGAHMERDIDVIVDIEPGEAQKLIGLVELLFEEWYVARDERTKRLNALKALASAKDAERKGTPSQPE